MLERGARKVVDKGEDLGYDLYYLDKVAKDYIPTVANVYSHAVSHCNSARESLDGAMRRPEHFGGSSMGPVHGAYDALHDAVKKVLSDTETNLDDTADALDKAAKLYAETDAAARNKFRDMLKPENRGKNELEKLPENLR